MLDTYPILGPILRRIEPERAHRIALAGLRLGLPIGAATAGNDRLATTLWGIRFSNPIGLAAGFDKSGEVFHRLGGLGFGFAEVGSVTPKPQSGNPRPRLFRLTEDGALINRMGFNNDGLAAVSARLERRRGAERLGRFVVGVNLGRNKDSADAEADYLMGVERLAGLADYLVINVSSPNTPNLRALQDRAPLDRLLGAVMAARASASARPPLLVKVAPDLSEAECRDVAEVALARNVDGLIVSNTTTARPADLKSPHRGEPGGLSGRPLFAPSTRALGLFYQLTQGRLPLVGVGGIASGSDAYAKIRAGASLIQLYTALVYQGPALIARIGRELSGALARDGFARLADAVGADHR